MGMIQHAPMGEMVPMRFVEQVRAIVDRLRRRERTRAPAVHAAEPRADSRARDATSRLAGGLAHDLNNILLVIQGYAEIAAIDEDAGPTARGHIEELRKALARAARLVDDLRLLGKGGPFDPREVDLNDAIARSVPALRAEAGEAIDVRFDPSNPPVRATVDERHLERMLLALAARARAVMPGAGTMTIRCAAARFGPTVTVLDTGPSLSAEDRARLFEPYPADGAKGRGLGLAVARAVVTRLGGTIHADGLPERGTAVVITLPAVSPSGPIVPGDRTPSEAKERPIPPIEARQPARRAPGMVLIADDDETTCALGARVLAQGGYKVLIARDGLEAVEIFTANRDTIALVVLDDVMPRLGGRAALKRIRAIAPQVPVLLACGYAWSLDGREQPGAESCELLPRPWLPRDLLRRVRAQLEPPA